MSEKLPQADASSTRSAPHRQRFAAAEPAAEEQLRAQLCAGDEQAFLGFASAQQVGLLSFARIDAGGSACEELVHAAFGDFLNGLSAPAPGLGLRASLYQALAARMRKRAVLALRPDPFLAIVADTPAVPKERFLTAAHRWAGGWARPPLPFPRAADGADQDAALKPLLEKALLELPMPVQAVALLRDVVRLLASEVCNVLALSEVPYRGMLHMARSHLRATLEQHYSLSGAAS
jgi:DNA-directed RNA polymerase specialized sigma24 family protein